jgi:hypothetical protein
MKWIIFIKWSTDTKIESYELEGEKSMMKTMEIEDDSDVRISNG